MADIGKVSPDIRFALGLRRAIGRMTEKWQPLFLLFSEKTMNRDNRRPIRQMLIPSIIVALVAAYFFYYIAALWLSNSERRLGSQRWAMLRDEGQVKAGNERGPHFVRQWKEAKTLDEQDRLWRKWTGNSLPGERRLQNIGASDPSAPEMQLRPTAEELPRLKEQGWETAEGEPLPLTPIGVSRVLHDRQKRALDAWQARLRRRRSQLPIAPILGAILGFAVVWAVHAAGGSIPWLRCRRFTHGLSEGQQEDDVERPVEP